MADLFSDHAALQPLHALLPENWHPTLVEMAEQVYLHLAEDAEAVSVLGHRRLAEIALGQIHRVSIQLGGTQFYLPKGVWYQFTERDAEIARRYTGNNKHELAREYRLSEMRIDQIAAAARRADFERRQGKLEIGD